jgi:hypothetical protein
MLCLLESSACVSGLGQLAAVLHAAVVCFAVSGPGAKQDHACRHPPLSEWIHSLQLVHISLAVALDGLSGFRYQIIIVCIN